PSGLDRVVRARILELGACDAPDLELSLVALELLRGLDLGGSRLRELRFRNVELGVALALAQIGELGLRRLELLLRLLAARGLLLVVELEQGSVGFYSLSPLDEQLLQPPAHG